MSRRCIMSLNYWLLVDTVRIPDAFLIVNNAFSIEQNIALFKGCDFEYLIDQSPLLVNLGQDKSALDKWKAMPYFDSSSVMFAVDASVETNTLLNHLQKLLIIQVDGKKMLFRYYTNVMWEQIESDQCKVSPQDLATLLGPAKALYWTDEEQHIKSIQQENIHFQYSPTGHYALVSTCFKQ
ncbi:hypothetical protein UB35_20410 [Photobacterium angustum]|nr:hypothetical protein UB35_20410 [Photobacterium angustum]PSV61324.1 DUF4123 domain-containing protein [Photobacterium angustum]